MSGTDSYPAPSAQRRAASVLALLLLLAGCAAPPPVELPEIRTGAGRMEPSMRASAFGQEIARAVTTHPVLTAGSARVLGAQAELGGAQSGMRPQLSAGLDLAAALVGGGGGRGVPVASVSQLLFDGGAARSRVAAATAGVVGQSLANEATAAQLTLASVEAWHDLAHQRALLDLAGTNLRLHEEFLELMQARLDGGAGTEADLLLARSRLADATSRQVTVRGDLDRAEAIYRELFGDLPARVAPAPAAPTLPARDDAELIATSPRLRGLDAEIAAATAERDATLAGRWPALGLGVQMRYDRDDGGLSAQADMGPRYEVMTGGRHAAATARAEARVAELQAERHDLERQIARALAFLRSDARTGQARLRAAREALAANEAAVAAAQDQFAVGRRSMSQLLDAQRDAFLAGEALLVAERDLTLSGYAALALTGDILDVFGIVLPAARPGAEAAAPAGTE